MTSSRSLIVLTRAIRSRALYLQCCIKTEIPDEQNLYIPCSDNRDTR